MDTHQIRCIRKSYSSEPHKIVEQIGGINGNGTRWRIPIERAIEGIEMGKWEFYIVLKGLKFKIIIAQHLGIKYLKCFNEELTPNILLQLPECP